MGYRRIIGILAPGKRANFLLVGKLVPRQVRATEAIYGIWHNGFGGQPYVGVDKLGWDGDSEKAVTPSL